jgi:hypothetical protein
MSAISGGFVFCTGKTPLAYVRLTVNINAFDGYDTAKRFSAIFFFFLVSCCRQAHPPAHFVDSGGVMAMDKLKQKMQSLREEADGYAAKLEDSQASLKASNGQIAKVLLFCCFGVLKLIPVQLEGDCCCWVFLN